MRTLKQIKSEVDRMAAIIEAAECSALPTYGHSEDFARPHIEVDSGGYHFVVVERGQEQSRFATPDLDELLYLIFQTVTFSLACDYELAYRIASQDSRRLIFQWQIQLLSQLSQGWAQRKAEDHERVLREHPFDDFASIRTQLTKELREEGHSPEVAWRMACQRYPLPVGS
jgi:hypothetical protein